MSIEKIIQINGISGTKSPTNTSTRVTCDLSQATNVSEYDGASR